MASAVVPGAKQEPAREPPIHRPKGTIMTYLIARIAVKPGAEAAVAAELQKLATASRAEAGCVRYEIYRAADDATALTVIERWADQAALDAHLKTPHFGAFVAACGDQFAAEPQLGFLEPLDA